MDYTQLIHDFVDGSLEGIKEEELFYILSSNEDMRSELKQQLAIKEAVKSDTKAFMPSAASTIKIFSTLGFSVPAAIATTAVSTGILAKLAEFFGRYSQGIVGGLIASLASVAIYFMFMKPNVSTEKFVQGISASQNSTIAKTESSSVVPKVISKANEDINQQKTKIRYITKIRYVDVPRKSQNTNLASTEQTALNNDLSDNGNGREILASNLDETMSKQSKNYSFNSNQNLPVITNHSENVLSNLLQVSDIGLTIEFFGNEYWHSQNPTINPKSYAKFNNTSINVLYSVSKYFSTGLEYKRENFFQRYEGQDAVGNLYRYEQQPNFNSFAIIMRGYYPDAFWNISPLAQISAGGNSAGYLGRFSVGGRYMPFNGISFILGLEYSELFYHHQNNNYTSGKTGLNYGVSVNF